MVSYSSVLSRRGSTSSCGTGPSQESSAKVADEERPSPAENFRVPPPESKSTEKDRGSEEVPLSKQRDPRVERRIRNKVCAIIHVFVSEIKYYLKLVQAGIP